MKLVLQRVKRAEVRVAGRAAGAIGPGLLVLLGIGGGDTAAEVDWMVEKVANLRIFEDDGGKMNRSIRDAGGEFLVVSQFTLYGDATRGRRPDYLRAARPEVAEPLCRTFVERLRGAGFRVGTGVFGAAMEVELVNDGPVTILLERERDAA